MYLDRKCSVRRRRGIEVGVDIAGGQLDLIIVGSGLGGHLLDLDTAIGVVPGALGVHLLLQAHLYT